MFAISRCVTIGHDIRLSSSQQALASATDSCKILAMAFGYRLQSNPVVGKFTTRYLLPLGTRQVGDDVVFFNFGYEERTRRWAYR
jgi:hypothetical protein